MKIFRARQTTEWIMLTGNMNCLRRHDLEIDFKLAMLLTVDSEITDSERNLRWDSLCQDEMNRALRIFLDERLHEVKWAPVREIPDDIWEGWCDRFQEAKELLEDIPSLHREERRLRTPGFFTDLKKE
jgi:hypothetical protein